MNIQQALKEGILTHNSCNLYQYTRYNNDGRNGDIDVYPSSKQIELYGYQNGSLCLTFEEVIRLGKFLEQLEA